MQSEEEINAVLSDLAADLPGFIAASLVDLDSGMTLGVFSKSDAFDLTSASAYNSELVKQKRKIMVALGLAAELEDITMNLTDQVHIIELTASGESFVYVAVDRAGSNIAIIRKALRQHVGLLNH